MKLKKNKILYIIALDGIAPEEPLKAIGKGEEIDRYTRGKNQTVIAITTPGGLTRKEAKAYLDWLATSAKIKYELPIAGTNFKFI